MTKENQYFQNQISRSNFRAYIILYLDIIIRSFISFALVGVLLYIFLGIFLKMKFIYILPIAFLMGILISPLLSRIKLGEKTIQAYENMLDKFVNKIKKDV
jgi:Cu/Ag efflux pump CusA